MDYLKELSLQLGGKIKLQEVQNTNFKERCFRRLLIKNYRNHNIEIQDYGGLYLLEIKVNSDLAFSINNPDGICCFNKAIDLPNIPYKAYASQVDYKLG